MYRRNDEIHIPINQQDVMTAPFVSQIYIKSKMSGTKAACGSATVAFVNKTVAFIFNDIRYKVAASGSNAKCRHCKHTEESIFVVRQ